MNLFQSILKRLRPEPKTKTIRLPVRPQKKVQFGGLRPYLPLILLWFVVSITLTFITNIELLRSSPEYHLGEIAEKNVKATHDFLVEDIEATERDKQEIIKTIAPSYDFDPSGDFLMEKITDAFKRSRELISTLPTLSKAESDELKDRIKSEFFYVLGIPQDELLFQVLLKHQFKEEIENILKKATKSVYEIGIANFSQIPIADVQNGILLRNIVSGQESTVKDLDRFLDLEDAKHLVIEKIKEEKLEPSLRQALTKMALQLIHPNINYNKRHTITRIENLKNSVRPKYQLIKKGEIIIRQGEKITFGHLRKLQEESTHRKSFEIISKIAGSFILNLVFFFIMYYIGLTRRGTTKFKLKDLVFLTSLLVFFSLFSLGLYNATGALLKPYEILSQRIGAYLLPVASLGLIVSIFGNLSTAVTLGTIFTILASSISGNIIAMVLYFLPGTLIGIYDVRFAKDRSVIIKASLKIGFTNLILALGIELFYYNYSGINLLVTALAAFLGGLLTGVITTGLLPLIEMIFGYTNNIKLIELANLDSPIMKDLMVQAPGTYHHSIIVSTLAEAAATNVGANPILCKVASLYHDIGKIKMPLYFVENQINNENKHEKLAPSMSALILLSHVKDGVDLAIKSKLPKEIIEIIQQHHGTGLIQFFYNKAKEQAEKKGEKYVTLKEEDFRYPGPKPQTKEAALVMLSDQVEASSRTLEDPTPSRIKGLIQRIINKSFADGQLDECDLTLKDLHQIAKSFNKTLTGLFHQRIQYPDQEQKGTAVIKPVKEAKEMKEGDGDTGQLSGKEARAKGQGSKEDTPEGLRRLGA